MNLRLKAKLVLACLGAMGIVASGAMLATAAPEVVHKGAAAVVYCLPGEKASRKDKLTQAKATDATVRSSADRAAAAVVQARAALVRLTAQQARAKQAYFASHRNAAQRSRFVAAQLKARAKLKASLDATVRASSSANAAAAAAAAARASAQAAYDQCS